MASGAYSNVSLAFGVQERQTGKVRFGNGCLVVLPPSLPRKVRNGWGIQCCSVTHMLATPGADCGHEHRRPAGAGPLSQLVCGPGELAAGGIEGKAVALDSRSA